jgi:type III secretory pathway component EscU
VQKLFFDKKCFLAAAIFDFLFGKNNFWKTTTRLEKGIKKKDDDYRGDIHLYK